MSQSQNFLNEIFLVGTKHTTMQMQRPPYSPDPLAS